MRPVLLASLPLLAGCGDLEKLLAFKDTVEGYTNDFAASASVLGVAPAEDPRIDEALALTDLGTGAHATAFLLTGGGGAVDARVRLVVQGDGLGMAALGGGEYEATGEDGLVYVEEAEARLEASEDGIRSMVVDLPPAPSFALPATAAPGEDLAIDLSGQDYDGVLVMVLDVVGGGLTWEERPATASEFYDFTRGGDGVGVVSIPGVAFPGESVYAVGVAGTWSADPATFEEINVALSTGFAGRYRFETVCTYADTALCDAGLPAE